MDRDSTTFDEPVEVRVICQRVRASQRFARHACIGAVETFHLDLYLHGEGSKRTSNATHGNSSGGRPDRIVQICGQQNKPRGTLIFSYEERLINYHTSSMACKPERHVAPLKQTTSQLFCTATSNLEAMGQREQIRM